MAMIPGVGYQLPSCDPPLNVDLTYNETTISFRWHTFFLLGEANMKDAAIALLLDATSKEYSPEYCCVLLDKKTWNINLIDDSPAWRTKLRSDVFDKFKELKEEFDKIKPLAAFL